MLSLVAPSAGLQKAAVARRSEALFRSLASDYLLREQFVTDPAHIFFEYVHSTKLAPETAAATNRLIYAVMSSSALLHWFHDYLRQHLGRPPELKAFLNDFTRAAVVHQADHVVTALLYSALLGQGLMGFSSDFPFFLVDQGILANGMRCGDGAVTPDTGPTKQATDTSPTTQATDTGPTKQATDTGRGGLVFTGVDAWSQPLNSLAEYANHLRVTGALNVDFAPL